MPISVAAPGPGRSAAESTSGLKVGGMQNTVTRVDGTGAPPVVAPVAGEPVTLIVRAMSSPLKAPGSFWRQCVKPVWAAQSESAVQETGGFLNDVPDAFAQKPQNTFDCDVVLVAVSESDPVVRLKAIGRFPRNLPDGGGQSWLVG